MENWLIQSKIIQQILEPQYQKDLFNKFKKQIFRNILNLNKYNPDNLEEEDDTLFFYRDIKP